LCPNAEGHEADATSPAEALPTKEAVPTASGRDSSGTRSGNGSDDVGCSVSSVSSGGSTGHAANTDQIRFDRTFKQAVHGVLKTALFQAPHGQHIIPAAMEKLDPNTKLDVRWSYFQQSCLIGCLVSARPDQILICCDVISVVTECMVIVGCACLVSAPTKSSFVVTSSVW
jgi:hypothetical protein